MTNQFFKSIDFWEKFISLIEGLETDNHHIPWNDEDIKTHGILHLTKRVELADKLVALRDEFTETFDDVINEHDPDLNLERIDRCVDNINHGTNEIERYQVNLNKCFPGCHYINKGGILYECTSKGKNK